MMVPVARNARQQVDNEQKGRCTKRCVFFFPTAQVTDKRTLLHANRMQLADRPEVVVATPSRALAHLRAEVRAMTTKVFSVQSD